jgi:hypothetical protein
MSHLPCHPVGVKIIKSLPGPGAAPGGGAAGGCVRRRRPSVGGPGHVGGGVGSSPPRRLARPAPRDLREVAGFGAPNSSLGPAVAGFGGVLQILPVKSPPDPTGLKTIKHVKTQKNTDKKLTKPAAPVDFRPIRPNRAPAAPKPRSPRPRCQNHREPS